ncbi:MAG: hypothetical protein IT353_15705 [Gemmatimonadaceae bacterium]|nr:hypothetical protein [Gemmatimonadaceae bacterium]
MIHLAEASAPPSRHRFRSLLLCGALAVVSGSCRDAVLAYGPDPASARTAADALVGAFEDRFTNVVRDRKFANARMRMARYALAPSKVANDTAVWSSMRSTLNGAERDLQVVGARRGNQFLFTSVRDVPAVARTGDSRHTIALSQLSTNGEWQWTTVVENAVGSLPVQRVDLLFRSLFAAVERNSTAIRADYHRTMPRATTAMGRLLLMDSILTTPQSDGSHVVTLHMVFTPERLSASFPAFAKFVKSYVGPARYRFQLRDRAGGEWFDISGAKSRVVLRFRSQRGVLQPLVGAARAMPDTLALHVEGFAKLGLFTVGATELVGEFVHVSTSTTREWAMRFTREPKWHLPLIGERLLRSPLRRPFAGGGVVFRIGFAQAPSGQTLFGRTAKLAVQESAIMRFLGNLGFTAMSDFAGTVEEEENRFFAELFVAMRADIGTALGG